MPVSTKTELDPLSRGVKLLHDPVRNKGTAFTEKERDALGLRGLLPPRIISQDVQLHRSIANVRSKASDLERYIFLVSLQDRNEVLFYRLVMEYLEEIMPLIYTPTVGKACQEFGHIFRRPRGLYVSANDRGRVEEVLRNWPHADVRMIVVTDGERILGLGDLGADGMGIPIGKLSLYTACAGVHPTQCLPVMLDVGTNNEPRRADPLYLGLPRARLQGAAYDDLVEELVVSVQKVFPDAVLQFEDFATAHAMGLLERYRHRARCFNDDIQGTGAVGVAGLFSAARMTGVSLASSKLLFLGAGEAGVGISNQFVAALSEEGVGEEEARQRCWLFDTRGLVVRSRQDLAAHKRTYAHEHETIDDLETAVRTLRPTALIGVSGAPGTFTPAILQAMAEINEQPIIFALSNPTKSSECSAREAYEHTEGRAIFASGSPFPPVDFGGRTFLSGQGNNAYIFPGVGLGVIVARADRVTDEMFTAAARTLAAQVRRSDLKMGRIYPALRRIREVSASIAVAVAEVAYRDGLARRPRPEDLAAAVRAEMFWPQYQVMA